MASGGLYDVEALVGNETGGALSLATVVLEGGGPLLARSFSFSRSSSSSSSSSLAFIASILASVQSKIRPMERVSPLRGWAMPTSAETPCWIIDMRS